MTNVLVIGGGPAGSTASTLLAKAGVSVTLLERATFPRYHIGESCTVSCRSLVDYIGALEKVDNFGFTRKSGVLLRWGDDPDWVIDWSSQFGFAARSWQVDREDFDKILLDHAKENGVNVVEGAQVKRVLFEDGRSVGAEWVASGEDTVRTARADFVLDASGRAGLISAQHFNNRQPHDIFRNVAIWGYFNGGELLPGTPDGGIDVISSPEGWYWVIPLRDNRFSVGYVTHQSVFVERRKEFPSTAEMLLGFVNESPTVRDLVANASLAEQVRVEQDFSYAAEQFSGPGHFLLGDAACFLDPLLSTGVHLAMYSGLISAACVLGVTNGDVTEDEAGRLYESLFRNAYGRLFTLVAGFYQKHAGRDRYLDLAADLARETEAQEEVVPEAPRRAFGEVIGGMTDLREAKDSSGRGGVPIGKIAVEAMKKFTPADGLVHLVQQAQANAYAKAAGTPLAQGPRGGLMSVAPEDFYDSVSGLHLVMTPRLGIQRVAPVRAEAAAAQAAPAGS